MDPFSSDDFPPSNISINLSPQPNLFSEVGYSVDGTVTPKLLKLLENGGAKQRTYAGVGVTHFIAGPDADEIKVEEVKDIFEIPIVAPRWITYSVLLQKVLPIHGFNGELGQLFSSVTATVSGIKGTDLKVVWANLTYHGGTFTKRLTEKCTHLITNSCTGNKYKLAQQKGKLIICIDWLIESIVKGKLEDVKPYHPSLLVQPIAKVLPPEIPIPNLARETTPQRPPFPAGVRPSSASTHHWTQQQQAEIIRQIQSDPQIKQQWGQMDHAQRTLLIQKLAQRNREDHLRREMMIRQQQMNLQNNVAQQRQHQLNLNLTSVGSQMSNVPQTPPATPQQIGGMPHTSKPVPNLAQGDNSGQADKVFSSHQRMQAQHQSPVPQLQQHKFFQTPGQELQMQNQAPGQLTIGQQRLEMIRAQQIFSPHFAQNQQRINVRHVFLHQGEQPRLQQQHIILQQPSPQDVNGNQQQKLAILSTQPQVQATVSSPQWITSPIRQSREPITPPGQIQTRPPVSDPSQIAQQWCSPIRHQSQPPHGSVIYTTSQHNLPFVQVVNSKTKTALANLLSNRLQGNSGPEPTTTMVPASSPQQVQCPPPQPIAQIHHAVSPPSATVPCQQNLADRRTLSNLNNTNGKPQQIGGISQVPPQTLPLATSRTQFYGHDPNIKLPSDGFLLGCVFWAAQPLDFEDWEKSVEQYGGEVERSYCARLTHVLCTTQKFPEFHQAIREGKRMVTLHWLSDICLRKCVVSPFYALHLPVPITGNELPLEGECLSVTGFSDEDRARVKTMCSILGATVTPCFTKFNMALVTHKPEGAKYQKAREWKKPVVNVQFLNELMFGQSVSAQMIHSPKYQHFSLEQPFRCDIGLVSQLMAAWKVPIRVSSDSFEKYRYRKRALENKDESEHVKRLRRFNSDKDGFNTFLNEEGNTTKKEPCPPPVPVIVMSGFGRVFKDKMKENIEALGAKVTEDVYSASHLITKPGCRTKKLFVCLSRVSFIASTAWIYDSLAQGKLVDVSNYIIEDTHFEINFEKKFSDILLSPDRMTLFAGLTFFLTPTINPSRTTMREIIEAAGGQVDIAQHSLKSIRALAAATRKYIIITCSGDLHLVNDFIEEKEGGKIAVYATDDVFASIIQQRLLFN